ncbi:MAG: HAMP domain-containing sensor histidine kinase [Bacteroidales bacterium]
MNKVRNITILAILAVISLQGLWLYSMHTSYLAEQKLAVEKYFSTAIEKEIVLRNGGSGRPFVTVKSKEFMTPREIASYKGDTIRLSTPKQAGVAKSFLGIIVQVKQDSYMALGQPLNLFILDSLFVADFGQTYPHVILSYNKNNTIQETIGSIKSNQLCNIQTDTIPIGTKGLQSVQLKMEIPLSGFIVKMIYIFISSVLFILIALYGLCYQFFVIRKKEELILKKETRVNGIIHDLKAPLNGVLALLEWLKKGEPDISKQQMIEDGKGNLHSLVLDIESLLMTAGADKKQISLNKENINLQMLANKAKLELDRRYEGKKHTITIDNQLPQTCVVVADAFYIGNVFINLIENALKYSNEKVNITVTLSLGKKEVIVSVADNGWGIARQYQKKIFTQFYQVPQENRKTIGYGIGLVYVKYIIQAHGGVLKLNSAEGYGSNFYFNLPL